MSERYRAAAHGARGEIYIYDDIGESPFSESGVTAKRVAEDLKRMGNVRDVDLYLNSYGGSVFQGLAIYNVLRRNPARIMVHVDGMAASAASVVAMAGDVVKMAGNAFLMIHDAWAFAIGNAAQLRKTADELDMTTGSIADTYVARTGATPQMVRDWMSAETWFNAADAVRYGFADEVVAEKRAAALYRPGPAIKFQVPDYVVETLGGRKARYREDEYRAACEYMRNLSRNPAKGKAI